MFGLVVFSLPPNPAAAMPTEGRLRRTVYLDKARAYAVGNKLDARRYAFKVVTLALVDADPEEAPETEPEVFAPPAP